MLPSATDLKYFAEVSRTLNISRAAERIGISQPTLTQAIRKLEQAVGTQLLIRTKTGVQLTQSGYRVCAQVSKLLETWTAIEREAFENEHELQGKFRVGCHPSVAGYTLPKFFRELAKVAPKVEIELVHDLSRRITEAVINFRVDIAFVINPVAHPDLVLKKIGDDVVGIFHFESGRYADKLFGDQELIQTQDLLKRLAKTSFSYSQFVPCPNLEVVHRLVSSGAGYGILPGLIAKQDFGAKLSLVDRKLPNFKDELYLIYRKEMMSSHAAKTLLELGRNVFKDS